jgi:hypothetical protein
MTERAGGSDVGTLETTAKLENGVRVMVPPHVEAGTRIVVNMSDLSYVERAKD